MFHWIPAFAGMTRLVGVDGCVKLRVIGLVFMKD